jgi:hypothetical protein
VAENAVVVLVQCSPATPIPDSVLSRARAEFPTDADDPSPTSAYPKVFTVDELRGWRSL